MFIQKLKIKNFRSIKELTIEPKNLCAPLPKQKEIAKKVEAIRIEIAEIKSKANGILETTQKEIGEMLKA